MALRDTRTEHGLEGGELEALLGDRRALDHVFSVTYEELRRLASSVRRSDPNASLSPTTLVNEAWLKLRNSPRLAGLARLQPRQATVVESRFFGGLDVKETAELLGVSEATILRDWRAAKAWLARELRRAS